MGRLGHGQLSQATRAIKWREKKAIADAAWLSDNRESFMALPDIKSSDAVGVFKLPPDPEPAGPADPPPSFPQEYHCSSCKSPVGLSEKSCPICEKGLNWEGLAG